MRRVGIGRFQKGGWKETEDWVAEEGFLQVKLPSGQRFTVVLTPEKIREFVYGHLLGHGWIREAHDVQAYHECWDLSTGNPGEKVEVEVVFRGSPEPVEPTSIIWTACGQGHPHDVHFQLQPRPWFSAHSLVELPQKISGLVEEFRLTGAYHYAFLFDRDLNLRAAAKDIGRHNAVDKVLGEELLREGRFCELFLFTTGRISADLVVKSLRAGIPLVVSQGAAFLGAITLARRHNLGLVAFLRGRRFNLYSGEGWFS